MGIAAETVIHHGAGAEVPGGHHFRVNFAMPRIDPRVENDYTDRGNHAGNALGVCGFHSDGYTEPVVSGVGRKAQCPYTPIDLIQLPFYAHSIGVVRLMPEYFVRTNGHHFACVIEFTNWRLASSDPDFGTIALRRVPRGTRLSAMVPKSGSLLANRQFVNSMTQAK